MSQLAHRLDRAGEELRASVARVRGGAARADAGQVVTVRTSRTGRTSAFDQSIAALHAVVWIAAFVQSVFNEIAGRDDEL